MANQPDPTFWEGVVGALPEPEGFKMESIGSSTDSIVTKARVARDRAKHIASIDYGAAIEGRFAREEIDRRYRDLPISKPPENNIRFLGSSFSGVDIKVVAHMYDQQNIKDETKEKIEQRLEIANAVKNGCQNLLSGGLVDLSVNSSGETLTDSIKREIFLAATGMGLSVTAADLGRTERTKYTHLAQLTGGQQEASSILLSQVYKNNPFTFIGAARMRNNARTLRDQYENLVRSLEEELERLKNLDSIETSSTVVLGTLQTISVQTFREKNAVRALGHTYAKSYTRGTRTIGGSCIFTIFNENALASLIRGMSDSTTYGERDSELSTLIPDQLPPIDLTIAFANEYGALSDFRLYGVEFFTDGSVFSIEDLLSEETMNFVCRDADIMTSRGRISLSRLQRGMHNGKDDKDLSGTSLLFDNQDYYDYLDRLGVRRRLLNR